MSRRPTPEAAPVVAPPLLFDAAEAERLAGDLLRLFEAASAGMAILVCAAMLNTLLVQVSPGVAGAFAAQIKRALDCTVAACHAAACAGGSA